MEKESKLVAQKRDVSGTRASRRLRREGRLPGIVNNEKGKPQMIQINRHDFELMLQHHRSESLILDLQINGSKPKKVLLKEVQHDPVSDQVLHADFVGISMTRKMRVHVPVILVGEAVGVKDEGGVLDHLLREIEVECLPADLVEIIEVDVSELKIGDTILVNSLKVDPKLNVLTDGDVAVAGVSMPRIEEEPVVEEAAEGAEQAEPAVIGEEKKEEVPDEKDKDQKSAASGGPADKTEDAGKGKGKGKESKREKSAGK